MSFRPPFPGTNAPFTPGYNNNNSNNNFVPLPNNSFPCKSTDAYQPNMQNTFTNFNNAIPSNVSTNHCATSNSFMRTMYNTSNKSNQDLLPPSQVYNNNTFSSRQQSVNNIPFPFPNSINTCPGSTQNSVPPPPNFSATYNQHYSNRPLGQNLVRNPVVNFQVSSDNTYYNKDQGNISNQRFSYPGQNTANNIPSTINFQGYQNNVRQSIPSNNVSTTFNSLPPHFLTGKENTSNMISPTANNSVCTSGIIPNQALAPVNNSTFLTVPTTVPNLLQVPSSQWQNNCVLNIPPPSLQNNTQCTPTPTINVLNPLSEKKLKLANFLAKFSATNKKSENKITVPEFRSALKDAFSMMKYLSEKKSNLKNLIDTSESEWSSEMQSINNLREQLSEMCSLVSSPVHLNSLLKKLECIKKKRDQKKKTKLNKLAEKIKAEQNRKLLHQEIDKWLDDIKEKNLKLKREVEMKKEADFILLEVRKKIQEANRTIEKIKVFEKLRNARQANSVQKGLHILPEHNEYFEKKVSILKETMLKQLADYEAEEKALKVMLETEQEGQFEEKTQWELKKIKTLQQKRQNHIKQCLFGISDDPLPTDPLYLFHKYHTSANNSIENLVQIRHHWDLHIAEDGESVPQQWVVPIAPSNPLWDQGLMTSKN